MVLSDDTQVNDNQVSSLKSFKIYGLFGYKDIELPLDQQVLILIAENGSGKTTILNALYYVFAKNSFSLKFILNLKKNLS
jgi:recombinational DNA repair ATPase RecF